ncbi:MAG: putative permease [Candidatus Syntrophoarchaeum sp. GoM_oil]|nr:MAG: putative permease [Candidatus Syntrophoarchaeum sp. GoM_oil]
MINEVLFKIGENTWYYTKEALPWLILGFLMAGLLKAFVPEGFLFKYLGARNMRSVLNATLIGIPLPLCSCGVIPAGIGLYEQGVSRASTLAFLIATPTTAITTILVIEKSMGRRCVLLYLGSITILAILFSYTLEAVGWL